MFTGQRHLPGGYPGSWSHGLLTVLKIQPYRHQDLVGTAKAPIAPTIIAGIIRGLFVFFFFIVVIN